jgi:hypothetical protein
MSKNILFFSKYCSHSIECIEKLGREELSKMAKICVDDRNIQLPSFIKVVPTIYLTTEKNILCDEDLDLWIKKKTEPEVGDLDAYQSNSFVDMFAPLENQTGSSHISSGSFLDQDTSINTSDSNYKKRSLEDIQRERELIK